MSGNQDAKFRYAASQVVNTLSDGNIRFEYLSIKNLRESDWTVVDFVDWLLGSHIHFILTHVHQGLESFGWGVEEIYNELQRLRWHPGFPEGDELSCPVFTQDKMKYIRALAGMTMPTFAINISCTIDDADVQEELDGIMRNSQIKYWILKAPFTTNSQHFKSYVENSSDAFSAMNRVTRDLYHNSMPTCYEIPYMMLQERVKDNAEVKMIFLNFEFNHFASTRGRNFVTRLPGYSEEDLIAFGYSVLEKLKSNNLGQVYILDGLVRIDIFKANSGELVLNEVESLEAGYQTSDAVSCARVDDFLHTYWETKIYDSINRLLNPDFVDLA